MAGPDGTAAHPVSQLLDHLDEVSRARSKDCVRLLDDVEDIRRGRQRECVRLLQELTPHLRAARTVERELDRHLARRFNVFRYLRDDELGLSRMIAELLDPGAEHGQGATFLEAMLELLGVPLRPTATDKIRIVQERGIPGGRRIDVTVDIPTDDGTFCLAFENKPYADDQPGQCRDYMEFLGDQYRERFLLVYLPRRCRMPDESSLPPADHRRWNKQFCVLPYVADDVPLGADDPPGGDGGKCYPGKEGVPDMRRLPILVLLGVFVGACGIFGVEFKRVVGTLSNGEYAFIVPDSVLVGEPFTVRVETTGGGRDRKGQVEVQIQGNVATITPYDYEYTGGGDIQTIQYRWVHLASVRFVEIGEAQVILRTRNMGDLRRTLRVFRN